MVEASACYKTPGNSSKKAVHSYKPTYRAATKETAAKEASECHTRIAEIMELTHSHRRRFDDDNLNYKSRSDVDMVYQRKLREIHEPFLKRLEVILDMAGRNA